MTKIQIFLALESGTCIKFQRPLCALRRKGIYRLSMKRRMLIFIRMPMPIRVTITEVPP